MVRTKNPQIRHIVTCNNGNYDEGYQPSLSPSRLPSRSRKSSHPSRIYNCPHCTMFFHDKNNAKRHVQVCHNLLPVRYCNFSGCDFQSQLRNELVLHQQETQHFPPVPEDANLVSELTVTDQVLSPTWAFMTKYLH